MESSRFCGVFCSEPCSWATACRPCKNLLQSRALKVAILGIESEARTITVEQAISEVDFQRPGVQTWECHGQLEIADKEPL
jgi:hypothetical protein